MEEMNELKPGTKDYLKAENEMLKEQRAAQEAELKALREQLEAARVQREESSGPAVAEAPAEEAKVRIKLPLTRTDKDDVYVGLNGKTYLIKRGVEVEVPEGVARVLERREKMLSIAMEYEEAASAPLDQLAAMYNK